MSGDLAMRSQGGLVRVSIVHDFCIPKLRDDRWNYRFVVDNEGQHDPLHQSTTLHHPEEPNHKSSIVTSSIKKE